MAGPTPWLAGIIACALAIALSAMLTGVAYRYAWRKGIVDSPGSRRSHSIPTPRGGGIGLVVSFSGTLLALIPLDMLPGQWAIPLALGVAAMGMLGWLDDHRSLPAVWRLVAQTTIAAAVLWSLGGLSELRIGTWVVSSGWWIQGLALVAMVWLTNLFNFMDGIDGLAIWESLFATVSMALVWLLTDVAAPPALLILLFAAASLGFLPWNWPRARVFMGDAGSSALGFGLSCYCILGPRNGLSVLLSACILAIFVVDATATLLWRLVRGQQWYTAHREHAYQLLVRAGWSHRRVVAMAMAINVLFILPLVWWARNIPQREILAASVVFVALLGAWLILRFRVRR